MKFINGMVLILLYCLNPLYAQDTIHLNAQDLHAQNLEAKDTTQKIKIYLTWVSLNSEPFKTRGVLYEIKDSSIAVSSSVLIQDYSKDRFEVTNLNINTIETIKTRRKNNIGKGILIGTISGFIVGGLSGLSSGDDPPCSSSWFCFRYTAEEKALMMGIPLAGAGAVIGALIGSIKVKIPINGSFNNYNKNKNKLREYSIKKE